MTSAILQILVGSSLVLLVFLKHQLDSVRAGAAAQQAALLERVKVLEQQMEHIRVELGLVVPDTDYRWSRGDAGHCNLD